MSLKLQRDEITPALNRLAASARSPGKVLRPMGAALLAATQDSFDQAGARPAAWPAKKDGTPATLRQSGTLSRSFRLEVTRQAATVSNPVIYAATHQYGRTAGRGAPIPARPFVPALDGRLTPAAEEKIRAAGARAMGRE